MSVHIWTSAVGAFTPEIVTWIVDQLWSSDVGLAVKVGVANGRSDDTCTGSSAYPATRRQPSKPHGMLPPSRAATGSETVRGAANAPAASGVTTTGAPHDASAVAGSGAEAQVAEHWASVTGSGRKRAPVAVSDHGEDVAGSGASVSVGVPSMLIGA
jgi:hypothetical protein